MKKEKNFLKVGNMRQLPGVNDEKFINIIRSNVPTNLDENDIIYLKELGIKHIIDLRTKNEREKMPSCFDVRKDFNVYNISLPVGDKIPESVEEVPKSYIAMLDAIQEINAIFQIFKKGDGVLYFCNAGKDRTGVITILILMALGTPMEVIYMDYLKSNDYLNNIIKNSSYPEDIINIIIPKREYIEIFLELFNKKYISIENYLEYIGINSEELYKIRKNYLKI